MSPPRPVYPLRPGPGDHRFTATLVTDVAAVLTRHGFPPLTTANDRIHFHNRLHEIIYQETSL